MGESAFLEKQSGVASANVSALVGCCYYSWDLEALEDLRRTCTVASRGLELAIGRGLRQKLVNANQEVQKVVTRASISHQQMSARLHEAASVARSGRRHSLGGMILRAKEAQDAAEARTASGEAADTR